ncbi:exosortase A [Rhodoferax sp. WC2427]|uniref:exosortase A n=1 Tax=Rhodoferax sp. WC2427 TaxID=3234144 RepID=UPI003467CA5E
MSVYLSDSDRKIWRYAIFAFLVLISWVILLFWNTFSGMVSIWARSETFTHGFLVLPIVIWLIWRKRKLIVARLPDPNYFYILPIVAISLIWLLGDLVSINSVTQLAATSFVVLLVLAVFGWSVTSVIVFPLAFLFFSVPLGEFLLPLLMEWTAKFTVIAIRLSGVPVYQEGLQFVISSGSWSVVEACSGVRYLISSVMIGTLYSYLNYRSLNRRLIFICVSILVPVLANWMRAYFIVMLGHFSENRLAVGFDHLIYGWVFFGVVIMLMFLIGGRWAENTDIEENSPVDRVVNRVYKPSDFWLLSILIAIAMAIPFGWGKFILSKSNFNLPHLTAPENFSSTWDRVDNKFLNLKPNFHGYSVDVSDVYKKGSLQSGIYIAYYRNQDYDSKLVSSENSIFNSKNKDWLKTSGGNYVLHKLADPLAVQASTWRSLLLREESVDVKLQVWQFYWVNGLFTGSDYVAKIYGAVQRLFGGGDDSAVIVLYARDDGDGSAKRAMEEFLEDNYSEIKILLEKSRSE